MPPVRRCLPPPSPPPRRGWPHWLPWLPWLLLCVVLPAATSAATSGTTLPAYEHSAWSIGQGAPGDIWDIAQQADGSLLLATGSGLYRFDGRQFERRSPPPGATFASSNMTTLSIDDDGSVWIGYFNAGVDHLDSRGVHHFDRARGLPPGLLPRMARDGSGRLWAAADGGLRWFDGQRWQPPLPQWGIGDISAHWLLRDQRGTLWVLAGQQLWRLRAHADRFEPMGLAVSRFASLALRADGQIWLADRQRGVMPVADANGLLPAAQREAARLPQLLGVRIRFAADGTLWGSFIGNGGIFHVTPNHGGPPKVVQFDAAQGLSSTTAGPIFEDRERNIWVGTNLGLSRFRAHRIHARPLAGPADPLRTLYQAPNGDVFAYGEDLQPMALQRALLQAPAVALQRAAASSTQPLWLDAPDAITLVRDGRRHELVPAGIAPPRDLRAMLHQDADNAWFCFGVDTVLRYHRGAWSTDPGLPAQACSSAALGIDGEVLLGYPDGTLRRRHGQGWQHYGTGDGLQVGPVSAMATLGGRLWVAGETGLAVLGADQRFHRARTATPALLEGITGMLLDRNGSAWLHGSRGLLQLDAAMLERATLAGQPVSPRLFDTGDGLPGIAVQSTPSPSALLAADGLLWLSTNQGLAWLDTLQLHRNAPASTPRIGNVMYADQQQPLREGMRLPPGTTQLQIDYQAVSLSRPERTRYRYRLVGLDEHWQEAGALTRAFYTNLPPGNYRFEVSAANQDLVWSPQPAQRSFRIAPMWYQTLWFKAACALVLLALIALAMHLRSRRVTELVRARLRERHAERERIARELHDTLLQGTQGLILRLHAVSQSAQTPPPVREALEKAMQQAESALAEARERVSALREGGSIEQDLAAALVEVYGERATETSSPALRLNVEGTPRPLQRDAAEEVYLIGREALLNALQHARANAIEIELVYARRGLRLHVRDDGTGLPSTLAEGHWGLVGMRERAQRVGARLRLWSRPSLGTEVELSLPAERIYRHSRRRWHWRRTSGDTA